MVLGRQVRARLMRLRDGWRRNPELPDSERVAARGLKATPKKITGGQRFVPRLIELCQLRPDHAVLDVGCGGGGPALALTGYLSAQGRYEGLDILPIEIARAKAVISSRHPNFSFHVADIYNNKYNPAGKYTAAEYTFPFGDETFDVVFLNSVFTHMLPRDIENYLSQVSRVLKTGGRCLITYFLINAEAERLVASSRDANKTFPHRFENYRAQDKNVHERVVALDEPFVRGLYERCALRIVEPIHYGRWSGRKAALAKQDIIVAEKR